MKIIKAIIFSLLTLAGGFAAIAVPFRLIGTLTNTALHTVFAVELAVYFIIAIFFLVEKEKKDRIRAREKERRLQRREKFIKAQEEYYDFAA